MNALGIALWLTLTQLPPPRLAQPGEALQLKADLAEYDADEGVVRAEGGVSVLTGGLRLEADDVAFDLQAEQVGAEGDILFVDGNVVVFAESGDFSFAGDKLFRVKKAVVLQKALVEPGALLTGDRAALRRLGKNTVSLEADSVERLEPHRFRAEGMSFSPCDCKDSEPDFHIAASSADIIPGERALLTFPTIYVRSVPVMVLPALYVPLSNRRTGLLFPRPAYSVRNGFSIDQPLFITLGESWDTTVTAGYVFGQREVTRFPDGDDARVGSKGLRLSDELRYAPTTSTRGRAFVSVIDDRHHDTEPVKVLADGNPAVRDRYLPDARGPRGELSWRHATDGRRGFSAHTDVNLVSDAAYMTDAALDVTKDAPPYLRSQAYAAWRTDAQTAFLAGQYHQDLAIAPGAWVPLFGPNAPAALQRVPQVGWLVPERSLLGPLRGGVQAQAVRYQPLAPFGTVAQAGALPGMTRLDVAPSALLPLVASDFARAGTYALARADLASGAPANATQARAHAIAGAYAGTEVARVFGSGDGALRHSVAPQLELRVGSPRAERGSDPRFPSGLALPANTATGTVVDEFDRASPRDGFAQGVVSVSSRLSQRTGARVVEPVKVELGQGVDLVRAELMDAFGRVELRRGYFSTFAGARYDVTDRSLAQASLSGRVDDARGDYLTASYDRLVASGTDRMRAGLDVLAGWPNPRACTPGTPGCGSEETSQDIVNAMIGVRVSKLLALRYGVTVDPKRTGGTGSFRWVQSHAAGVSVTTNCDCWSLDVLAVQTPPALPSLLFNLDLRSFGSVGTSAF